MGDLISLEERRVTLGRAASWRPPVPQATFYFDLASPFTYLAAERVERMLGNVRWLPALGIAMGAAGGCGLAPDDARREAERRATALRMPLVWPDRYPPEARAAMRAAAYAGE